MTGVLPLSTAWCASFQYERRTTSRYAGSTYSVQISSGSLMCASQSKTGNVLVTRCCPLVTVMRSSAGGGTRRAVLFSAPERARSRPRRGERAAGATPAQEALRDRVVGITIGSEAFDRDRRVEDGDHGSGPRSSRTSLTAVRRERRARAR